LLAVLLLASAFAQHANAAGSDSTTDSGIAESTVSAPATNDEVAEQDEGLEYARDLGSGIASYYADRFAGKSTASGEAYDPAELTAAHPSLPFGSRVLVTSERTGKSVVVTINDRGPFYGGRIIDLSRAAASRIGLVRQGHGAVSLALLAD